MYKPSVPFNIPMALLIPKTVTVKASAKKTYAKDISFFGSFRTFGGTEKIDNGVLSVENTAVVECWYNPKIKSDCQVEIGGNIYEILGTPENIEMRNMYLKFKIRQVKGGA